MRRAEIAAYVIGTMGLIGSVESFRRMELLTHDHPSTICPDPPSEVARMLEIEYICGAAPPEDYPKTAQPRAERITLLEVLRNPEVQMEYQGLLKEYNTLFVSSGDERVQYLSLCSEIDHQYACLVTLLGVSMFSTGIGYMVGYTKTSIRREKEKNRK